VPVIFKAYFNSSSVLPSLQRHITHIIAAPHYTHHATSL